ncbi:chromatin regulator subfamily B member 1 [Trichinella spiralis]|uniref:chromatin regulator subfamily B member 1 n=1 Tax=Trichinella spiralis TaxID=6334 RepID=UPI0001EFB8F8|nr:chromatin regulator subfamily B member 1 [Trichinella spiralis]
MIMGASMIFKLYMLNVNDRNDQLNASKKRRTGSEMHSPNKTFGERPQSFALDESGERYYIGSEVGNYMKLFRGALYKKYPQLWRRTATQEEKKKMQELGFNQNTLSTNIMLMRASEVDEVLNGNDEKYRALSLSSYGDGQLIAATK